MRDKVILILILTILGINACKADSLLFGGLSFHTAADHTTNSFHRAVIYSKGKWLGGYLRNSYDNDSFVVAYKVYTDQDSKGYITTDIYLGVVRGYDRCFGSFSKQDRESGKSKAIACPIPVLNATIETDTMIKPVISIWGDAIVLTGKVEF